MCRYVYTMVSQVGERFGQGAWCAVRFGCSKSSRVGTGILLYTAAEVEIEIDVNMEWKRRDRYTARDRTDNKLDRRLRVCYIH
jgi:hypothetical protein